MMRSPDFMKTLLGERLGNEFEQAMRPMDSLYPQPEDADTTSQQLAKMLAEPIPFDYCPEEDSLTVWRQLQPPWTDWMFVARYCRKLSARLLHTMFE